MKVCEEGVLLVVRMKCGGREGTDLAAHSHQTHREVI